MTRRRWHFCCPVHRSMAVSPRLFKYACVWWSVVELMARLQCTEFVANLFIVNTANCTENYSFFRIKICVCLNSASSPKLVVEEPNHQTQSSYTRTRFALCFFLLTVGFESTSRFPNNDKNFSTSDAVSFSAVKSTKACLLSSASNWV